MFEKITTKSEGGITKIEKGVKIERGITKFEGVLQKLRVTYSGTIENLY